MKARNSNSVVYPLRITSELKADILDTSRVVGLPEADAMRKAIEQGLPILRTLLRKPSKKAA